LASSPYFRSAWAASSTEETAVYSKAAGITSAPPG
jgi:hypothetical protein